VFEIFPHNKEDATENIFADYFNDFIHAHPDSKHLLKIVSPKRLRIINDELTPDSINNDPASLKLRIYPDENFDESSYRSLNSLRHQAILSLPGVVPHLFRKLRSKLTEQMNAHNFEQGTINDILRRHWNDHDIINEMMHQLQHSEDTNNDFAHIINSSQVISPVKELANDIKNHLGKLFRLRNALAKKTVRS
jgi:hypothetical protein